jgi:hypothetical protein
MSVWTAAAQTSVVEGRVVSTVGNDPVRRATVNVRRPGQTLTVETNSNGAFRVDGLVSATYTISVQKNGFLPGGGREFDIGPDARISGIVVALTPAAVITGRVLDPDGDPISNATVRAMNYLYVNGRRQLGAVRTVTSDDRGRYRIFNLSPTRYFIQASRDGGTAFHPSAAEVEAAAPVRAEAGVESRGIDVVLHPTRLYTVRIRVTDNGAPLRPSIPPNRAPLAIPSVYRRDGDSKSYNLRWTEDVMEARDLPPGKYVFAVNLFEGDHGNRKSVRRNFEIAGADMELAVAILPPAEILGTVTGMADPPAVTIRFDEPRDDLQVAWATGIHPEKDGQFRASILPDRYVARAVLPEGHYLKTIRQGGRPLPGQTVELAANSGPLEFVLAEDGGEVAGVVVDGEDRTVRQAQVVLEPVAEDWPDRLKVLAADGNGNFRFHDVAPGDYRIFAWLRDEPDESRAVKLRVEPDGDHRVTLRVP